MGGSASVLTFKQFQEARRIYESENLKTKTVEQALPLLSAAINAGKKRRSPLLEEEEECQLNLLQVGDVVKLPDKASGILVEGVVTGFCRLKNEVLVDFGDCEEEFHASNGVLLLRSTDLEVEDIVEVRPHGTSMYLRGKVVSVNLDRTYDVKMESDDPEDYERGVRFDDIRKLMTNRSLAMHRWHHAVNVVRSMNAFASMGKYHSMAHAKLDAITEKRRRTEAKVEEAAGLLVASKSCDVF